jgi:uncharacterized protein YcbX
VNVTASLARIAIFPIKSLDGVVLDDVEVLAGGALAGDRRFALVDRDGRFINGKRTPAVHLVRAEFDLQTMLVSLRREADPPPAEFSLSDDRPALAEWLSNALGTACRVVENATQGFPDDTDAPGPTVISTATLRAVTGWFAGLTLDEARRRFRANLEIDGVEPFWEDRLVGPAGSEVPFRIGALRWLGIKACQRCVVPTRSSEAAEVTPGFQKTFAAERQRTLPEWATAERFDHFYRLAVNTRLAPGQQPAVLHRGDVVVVI